MSARGQMVKSLIFKEYGAPSLRIIFTLFGPVLGAAEPVAVSLTGVAAGLYWLENSAGAQVAIPPETFINAVKMDG